MGLFDVIASAISSINDRGCEWFCDECDCYMNDQPGFTTLTGRWTCSECGAVNDVSNANTFDPWNHDNDD